MKLLIKLAIAALFANAAYRVGSEYLAHIKFRDAVRDAVVHKTTDDTELKRRILELSSEYDIPLAEENFAIHREERHVVVEGRYEKSIEVVPTMPYRWPFQWTVDAMVSTTIPAFPPKR